jgi:hypothetical protein
MRGDGSAGAGDRGGDPSEAGAVGTLVRMADTLDADLLVVGDRASRD